MYGKWHRALKNIEMKIKNLNFFSCKPELDIYGNSSYTHALFSVSFNSNSMYHLMKKKTKKQTWIESKFIFLLYNVAIGRYRQHWDHHKSPKRGLVWCAQLSDSIKKIFSWIFNFFVFFYYSSLVASCVNAQIESPSFLISFVCWQQPVFFLSYFDSANKEVTRIDVCCVFLMSIE